MNTSEHLQYGKVAFRATGPADLDFVLAVEQHPENLPFIRQWSTQQHRAAIEDPNVAHFVIENAFDYRPVGFVILVGVNDPDLSLELKRIVVSDKRFGFGRDAVRLVQFYAFEKLACHRLWLDVMKNNKRAYKLYKSEGFRNEGVHREAVRKGDRFVTVKVMSILRCEYMTCHILRHTRLRTDVPGCEELAAVRLG
ncbi:MAG: GNAT family N-acetyltransferase [Candidatus Zixiibacteriota bacterium]|nr:MAG: GNAT family N-acetyltransferase [candidate division Zixibacteria bacterium]